MIKRRIQIEGARVLVMGLTFKENCPDLRNTRVVDIVTELQDFKCTVDVYDPWVTVDAANREYGIVPLALPLPGAYDGIVLAVAHNQFKMMGVEAIWTLGKQNHVLFDLKYLFPGDATDIRL